MNKFLEKLKNKRNDALANPPVTAVFLGDSVTHGGFELWKTGEKAFDGATEYESAYPAKFARIIHTLFPAAQLNVINSGIGGSTAAQGIERLERDVLSYSPDLVVVCFGLNDIWGGADGLEKNYTSVLSGIFDELNKRGILAVFMTPNMMNTYPVYTGDAMFQELGENISKKQNDGTLKLYLEAGKAAARAKGVAVCDVYSKWETLYRNGVDTTRLLANNLNHPTRDMHWLFAYSLVETVFGIQ
jgi:lysophospholipase L1-like esterase